MQSNLRRPTCTDQFAQSTLPRATCAEQLAQSNLHRVAWRWADLACNVVLSGQPWSSLICLFRANRPRLVLVDSLPAKCLYKGFPDLLQKTLRNSKARGLFCSEGMAPWRLHWHAQVKLIQPSRGVCFWLELLSAATCAKEARLPPSNFLGASLFLHIPSGASSLAQQVTALM